MRVSAFALIPVLALLLVLAGGAGRAEEHTTVALEEKLPCFFCSDHMTGSMHLAFCPDHRYSRVSREHLFVREDDTGTWSVTEDGVVVLTSDVHCQNLFSGPFEIGYLNREDGLDRLTTLSQALDRLQTSLTETTMTGRQFLDALHAHGGRLPIIKVDPARESVATTEILALRRFVDEARSTGLAPAVISLVPRRHRDVVYLDILPPAQGLWMPWRRDWVESSIREAGGKSLPRYIYAEIDEETYRSRVSTTQEFRYHTHPNANREVTTPTICGQPAR